MNSPSAVVREFGEDVELIARRVQQAKLEPLLDLIDGLQGAPAALIAALTGRPFGDASPEPAKALWEVFLQVLKATGETRPVESWRFVRNCALRLSGDHESPAAAASLLTGLLRHGEAAGINPEALGALRQDLMAVTPGRRKADSGRPRTGAAARSKPVAAALAGLALMAAVTGFVFYGGLAAFRRAGSMQSWASLATCRPEIAPAVDTGQDLALPGVRYCHYQAARLEIIKQAARSPEDVRAYNLLVVDYNSRCSDFFYQDQDLKQVTVEVTARRAQLEADAKRILGWPGLPRRG